MANWKVTFAGVDKRLNVHQPSTPQITLRLNNLSEFRCVLVPGYIPNKYDDVVVYAQDGVTKLFGGLVISRRVRAHGTEQQTTLAACEVIANDYSLYATWCYSSRVYSTSVTLKQVLTDLITDCLGTYGVTLSGTQPTGPTLPPFSWSNTKVSDALRALFTSTGYVATFDPTKVLSMTVPGTNPAPFTITDASPNCDSFEWIDSTYISANKVFLTCGPSGTAPYNQSWTQAGSATSWQADIPAAVGSAPPGYVTVGGIFKTVGTGAQYTWDTSTSPPTLRLGTDPTPGNGTVITLTYVGQYPFTVTATGSGSPVRAALATDVTITTLAAANAEAAGLLAALNFDPRVPTVTSRAIGWLPGQSLTTNLTARSTGAVTFTIGDTTINLIADTYWVYQFQATETTVYQGNSLDKWRSLLNAGSGTAIALSGGGGGGSGSSSPGGPWYLGGSSFAAVPAPASKTLIPCAVPFVAKATFTGLLRVNLKSKSGNPVKAIISDGTTDTPTSAVSSTTFVDTTVLVAITTGHTYHVYVQYTGSADDAYCGYAELEVTS